MHLAIWLALLAPGADPAPPPLSFRRDVAPILAARCLGCHNAKKAANDWDISTFDSLKRGGKGAGADVLVAGDPDASELIASIRPDASPRMPYKLPPLPDGEIATLERWVREGAAYDGPAAATLQSLVDPLASLIAIAPTVPMSDPATAVAFARDGATIAAAVGRDVVLYDSAKGVEVARLAGHAGPIAALRFTPDGKTLVVAGGRAGMFGFVATWDIASKERRLDLRGHTDAILAADLSPDGSTLATAGYDRLVILWDLAKGQLARTLREHTDSVHAVAFAPDGKRVASAGADRTVKVWDVAGGTRLASLSSSTGEVYAVAFGPGGKTLFAAGVDRSIRAWDASAKGFPPIRSVFAHDRAVVQLAVGGDGKRLYSAGEDRAVKVWDLATLAPATILPDQPDWPIALAASPNDDRLAVGRSDGSISLVVPGSDRPPLVLRKAVVVAATPPAEKPRPPAPAALDFPSPRGAMRGRTVRVVLTGSAVGRAVAVLLPEPGIAATIVPAAKPNPNRLEVDLAIAADARPGAHRIGVQTPLGVPAFRPFAVSEHLEVAIVEPDETGEPITPAATFVGAIEAPGDVDSRRIERRAGRAIVCEVVAKAIGSKLDATLTLLDESGRVVAEANGPTDPVLVYTPNADGPLRLQIGDANYAGSGANYYRLNVGTGPAVAAVFPLGVPLGGKSNIKVEGDNLAAGEVEVTAGTTPGNIIGVHHAGGLGPARSGARSLVTAEGPQGVESEGNDGPSTANPVANPGGISGRIGRGGDIDYVRFPAKQGERLVIECFGARLGSPVDLSLEILDEQGRAIPRAVLRPVAETAITFRDQTSSQPKMRLDRWDELAIDDYLLVGRELVRILELPKNPDDDCLFYNNTTRLAFLETTPEHHPNGQAAYKVVIHPAGATFPAGGVPPTTLNYRNDDGGPGFSGDPRVTFDPPADGTYLARVEDVRGQGGDRSAYHLVVRRPAPDFDLFLSPEDPNVPRGGRVLVTASIRRKDGFDDAVDVTLDGLPTGISATPGRIERGALSTRVALEGDLDAPAYSAPTWRATARASGDASGLVRSVDPGGKVGGRITVTPASALRVSARPGRIEIRPGGRSELTLAVERGPGVAGRVPIEVTNLPHGVRVLDIGLNGVLVTETQTERAVVFYAESWVKPLATSIFAVGKVEAVGTEHSSPPIPLVVGPSGTP